MSDVEEEVEPVTPTLSVNVSDTDGLAWLFTRTARVVAKAADPWWKETETQSEAVSNDGIHIRVGDIAIVQCEDDNDEFSEITHKRRFGLVAAIWKSSSHELSGVDDGIRLLVFWMRQVSPSAVAKSKNLPSQINGLVASGKYLVPGCNGVAVGLVTVIGRVADLPDLEGLIHAPLAAKPGAKVFALDSNRWLSCKGDKMGPGFKIEIREDTLRTGSVKLLYSAQDTRMKRKSGFLPECTTNTKKAKPDIAEDVDTTSYSDDSQDDDFVVNDSSNYVHRQTSTRGRASEPAVQDQSEIQHLPEEAQELSSTITGLPCNANPSRTTLGRPYLQANRKKIARYQSSLTTGSQRKIPELLSNGEDDTTMTASGLPTDDNADNFRTNLAQLGRNFAVLNDKNATMKAKIMSLEQEVASSGAARFETRIAELKAQCATLQKENDVLNAREKVRKAKIAEMMQEIP